MAFWKKLGKGLLKVGKIAAPIALGATGFGLPAAIAAGAGLGAASSKAEGGGWMSGLGSGALTGAMGGLGGGFMRGLAPSGGAMARMFKNPMGMMESMGGAVRRGMGRRQRGRGRGPYATPPFNPYGQAPGVPYGMGSPSVFGRYYSSPS